MTYLRFRAELPRETWRRWRRKPWPPAARLAMWVWIGWLIVYVVSPPLFFTITRGMQIKTGQINGAQGVVSINWIGYPKFPVTVESEVANCPFECGRLSSITVAWQNPLRTEFTCTSTGRIGSWTADYHWWATDARGIKTQKIKLAVTCVGQ